MTEDSTDPPVLNPRLPDGVFDAAWYAAQNPDVAADVLSPWEHFVTYGEAENRAPGPEFDPEFYARTYLPLEAGNATYHYIIYGRARGYLTRPVAYTRRESALAMRAALTRRRYPVLLIGSDAQHAGAPLLLLEVAKRLILQGFSPVFLLRRGGPLLDLHRSLGPTFIAAEGWDLPGLGSVIDRTTPVFANTGWGALVLDGMQHDGANVVMVHEMTDYLAEHRLLDAVGRARTVVASMPSLGENLARSLPESARIRVIRPGLMSEDASPRARRAVRDILATRWGTDVSVYIGAGYADSRKGFDLFVDAARGIHAVDPRARFVWLGELSGWASEIADAALRDDVPLLLPGFRRDSAAWYACADVYLLTSRQDPGPTTVMDAARVGVPFVAYAADIGLRSLGAMLDGVGVFVEDRSAFVEQATRFAHRDEARDHRAAHVTRLASFRRYVGELMDVMRAEQRLTEPPAIVQAAGARAIPAARITYRSAVSSLRRVARIARFVGMPDAPFSDYRPVIGPWMHTPSERRAVTDRPMIVAASASGIAPPDALRTAEEVRALSPGDAAWLGDPRLLRHLPHPAVVHLVRDERSARWDTVAAVEAATHSIAALNQHLDDTRLARLASRPSRIRASRPPRRPAVASAPGYPHTAAATAPAIGVFLHAYYVDIAERMIRRLERIDRPFSLYVSTDDESKARRLRALLPDAEVRVFPNVGRDVYPKLFGFAPEHTRHELVLHLHTKRSPHSSALAEWLDHILDRLLPSVDGVDAIVSRFDADPRLGMLSPAPFPGIMPSYRWGATLNVAKALTFHERWPLPADRDLVFPAGSMFWARPAALTPLQRLDVPPEAFADDRGMLDGTLAHTLERLFGVSCSVAGYRHLLLDPPDPRGRRGTALHTRRRPRWPAAPF